MDEPLNDHQHLALEELERMMLHRLDLLGFDVLFIVTGRDSRARRDV